VSDPLALVLLVVGLQLARGAISCVQIAVQAWARERYEVARRETLVALLGDLQEGVECTSDVDAITVSYSLRRNATDKNPTHQSPES
jgi:hypothetical protein